MFGKKTREINELKARVDELLTQLDAMSYEHVKELANYKTFTDELSRKVDELTCALDDANAEIARLKHKKVENATKKTDNTTTEKTTKTTVKKTAPAAKAKKTDKAEVKAEETN